MELSDQELKKIRNRDITDLGCLTDDVRELREGYEQARRDRRALLAHAGIK